MGQQIRIEIDASDLNDTIDKLKAVATPEQVERAMYRVFSRTGAHVRKTVKTEVRKEYEIPAGVVQADIKNARMTSGGFGGVGCIIPIQGTRKTIGQTYKATGYAKGWSVARTGRKYRVKAKIVKSGESVLPERVASYGGFPPFRNSLAKKLNMLAFTRETKARLPIRKIEGIAVPQMAATRSRPEIQKEILNYMGKRTEHELMRLIKVK